jgi:hypothetical protein
MSAATNGARSTTSKTSGKNVFSVSGDWTTNSLSISISQTGAAYDGSDANSWGIAYISGTWYLFNNGSPVVTDSTSPAPTSSSETRIYLDSSGLLYVSCDGNNLFGGNPSTNSGGQSISTATWFASVASIPTFGSAVSGTGNFSPTSLPSGWSAWDGGAPPATPNLRSLTGVGK